LDIGETLRATYGYGYFEKEALFTR